MINHLKKSAIFLFSSILLLMTSCKKDKIELINPPNNPPPSSNALYSGNTITTSVGGVVTDQYGNSISNALVTIGNKTGHTNSDGIFNIINVTVDDARAYVKIKKSGYFLGSRSFKPTASSINYVRIELLTKTVEGIINNSTGGSVNIAGGATLVFEAGDISLENGNPYSGNITVQAAYLDPMASNIGRIMPGDLKALDNSNNAVTLVTYGMLVVELVGTNGEALNVAQGKTVEIKMPVAAQQAGNAPTTIPLWYFDETYGNWIEEGQATLQGGFYIGEVSHFSFWNCDAPFPLIDFHCQLTCNSVPMSNVSVILTTPSGAVGYGYADENGNVTGSVPQNTILELVIKDECGSPIYTQTVAASSSNIELGNISMCGIVNMATISGNVIDCNNNPVTNGYVTINLNSSNPIQIFTNQNGQFSTIVNTCSSPTIEVTAFDLANSQQSATITVQNGATINLGAINTCIQVDEYINFILDGTQYNLNETGSNEVYSYYSIDSTQITGYFSPNYISLILNSNPVLGNNTCSIAYLNSYQIETPSAISTNITTLGLTSGSYIEGTFSGTFNETGGGPTHTISGSFRSKNQ